MYHSCIFKLLKNLDIFFKILNSGILDKELPDLQIQRCAGHSVTRVDHGGAGVHVFRDTLYAGWNTLWNTLSRRGLHNLWDTLSRRIVPILWDTLTKEGPNFMGHPIYSVVPVLFSSTPSVQGVLVFQYRPAQQRRQLQIFFGSMIKSWNIFFMQIEDRHSYWRGEHNKDKLPRESEMIDRFFLF